jgi:DNA-binding response OmpR family regulator
MKHRDIMIDLSGGIVSINDEPVSLTTLEYKLLCVFVKNAGKPLGRDFLRDEAWGSEVENINDNAVNVAINRLKKKIDSDGTKEYFAPVWGVGYKLL